MSKIEQIRIPVRLEKKSKILHRLNDDLKIKCFDIKFLEFDKNNRGNKLHDNPKIDFSCLCDYDNVSFKWQTSPITEVLSNIEFKTLNSHYKIIEYD